MAVSTADCDRRLSRAARDLLRQAFMKSKRTLVTTFPEAKILDLDESSSVWDWIERIPTATKCPLLAHEDILRKDEEHTIVIASKEMPIMTPKTFGVLPFSRRRAPRKKQQHIPDVYYQCAYCGKVFMTRYYVDLHMDRMHSPLNHTATGILENSAASICPARDWCAFLSDSNCRDHAVFLEPYYDRGSEGRGTDADMVARKVRKTTIKACSQQDMHAAQAACDEMILSCFPNTSDVLQSTLKEHFCSGLSCSDRLHKLVLQHTLGMDSWQSLQDEWYGEESKFLWLLVCSIVVVVSTFCYIQCLFGSTRTYSTRNSSSSTSRLLRRSKPKHKVN